MAHSLYHSSVHPFPSMVRPTATRLPRSRPNYLVRRVLAVVLMFVALVRCGRGARSAGRSRGATCLRLPGRASNLADRRGVHVAQPGDSLWSIAEAHRGDVAIDRYVDALIDLNGGTDVQIGQAIHLP